MFRGVRDPPLVINPKGDRIVICKSREACRNRALSEAKSLKSLGPDFGEDLHTHAHVEHRPPLASVVVPA